MDIWIVVLALLAIFGTRWWAISNTLNINGTVGDLSFSNRSIPISSDGVIGTSPSLPKAAAGTLSTRTGDDEGILTVGSGHGIVVDDEITVFWDGGKRYNMTVSAQDSTTITFGGVGGPGAGDVLPTATTVITVGKQIVANLAFEGDDLIAIMAACVGSKPGRAVIMFFDAGGIELVIELDIDNGYHWLWLLADGAGTTNPLAADSLLSIQAANGIATAQEIRVAANYDATP